MNDSAIRVFLVDDHEILLAGLKLLLKDVPNLEIIGTACNGKDLLEQLSSKHTASALPGVILMDIDMEVMDGHEATKQVKGLYPEIKVIMLTRWDQRPDINKAVAQGANGFLSKKSGRDKIVDAIFRVFNQGEFVVYTEFEKEGTPIVPIKTGTSPILLTDRESKILLMICQGWGIEQIGMELKITTVTAQTYLRNIKSKFRARSDESLISKAKAIGLCPKDQP